MMLRPDPSVPGLWVNPAWQQGTPGTFAVVIGVSRYTHLEHGDEPAADLGERWVREARLLGQLSVSALTAFRFFEWLVGSYRYAEAPIAKCWLLLAPTPAELAHAPAAATQLTAPTLAACEAAIGAWHAAIRQLPGMEQRKSRAIFFFSGHGLQVIADKQLLLPSDYLGGATPNWDNAISTHNLLYGMETLELPHRYYFVDACRNDFPEIRLMRPQGRTILPEHGAARSYPGVKAAAVLYATAASLQAWQPTDPANGPSLYGQALLAGLRGEPDIELRKKNGVVTVNFSRLEGFVGERVAQLLKGHGAVVEQPVQPGGTVVRDEVVAEIAGQVIAAQRPEIGQPATKGGDGSDYVTGARTPVERAAAIEQVRQSTLANQPMLEPQLSRGIWTAGWEVQHVAFGSELITNLWTNPQHCWVEALSSGERLRRDQLLLRRVAWSEGRMPRTYRIELAIDHADSKGHWLQLIDTGPVAHGCILPSDRSGQARYVVEFLAELDPTHSSLTLRQLAASLSQDSAGPLASASRLWKRYRDADVSQAVADFKFGELEQMVREKLESPLAATIAALILLRANRLELLRDWPRNLANWFPSLPDGAVLWAEQVMLQEDNRQLAVKTAVEYLGLLDERGLPFTSEAFSYAASLVARLKPVVAELPERLRGRFDRVAERIDGALAFFRPGGLFSSFSHFDPDTAPAGASPSPQPRGASPIPPADPTKQVSFGEGWVNVGGVVLRLRTSRS